MYHAMEYHHHPDVPEIRAAQIAFRDALTRAPDDPDSNDYWQFVALQLDRFDRAIARASRYASRAADPVEVAEIQETVRKDGLIRFPSTVPHLPGHRQKSQAVDVSGFSFLARIHRDKRNFSTNFNVR